MITLPRDGTDRFCHAGRSRDNLYEPQLADSEREAVSDLLAYLENVGSLPGSMVT